jgi:AraC-like DNA-binding protein
VTLDPLSDVLRAVRLTGAVFYVFDGTGPWVAAAGEAKLLVPILFPGAEHVVSYHAIVSGHCYARVAGGERIRLEAGDLILLPQGNAHQMASDPGLEAVAVDERYHRQPDLQLPYVLREGAESGPVTRVVCGFLACDARPFNPLLAALPPLLVLHSGPGEDPLAQLMRYAVRESLEKRVGSDSVLARLSELMFIEAVRRHVETLPDERTGWLAALRDPLVGRALARLHQEVATGWTLESLAAAVGTSRSVLAERFTALVGEPPMHYLTRWRMQVATRLLAGSDAKVAAVAAAVGYEAEAAFSRAFKKVVGLAPAHWRKRQAASGAAAAG